MIRGTTCTTFPPQQPTQRVEYLRPYTTAGTPARAPNELHVYHFDEHPQYIIIIDAENA
jgi:hypothetical protein